MKKYISRRSLRALTGKFTLIVSLIGAMAATVAYAAGPAPFNITVNFSIGTSTCSLESGQNGAAPTVNFGELNSADFNSSSNTESQFVQVNMQDCTAGFEMPNIQLDSSVAASDKLGMAIPSNPTMEIYFYNDNNGALGSQVTGNGNLPWVVGTNAGNIGIGVSTVQVNFHVLLHANSRPLQVGSFSANIPFTIYYN